MILLWLRKKKRKMGGERECDHSAAMSYHTRPVKLRKNAKKNLLKNIKKKRKKTSGKNNGKIAIGHFSRRRHQSMR